MGKLAEGAPQTDANPLRRLQVSRRVQRLVEVRFSTSHELPYQRPPLFAVDVDLMEDRASRSCGAASTLFQFGTKVASSCNEPCREGPGSFETVCGVQMSSFDRIWAIPARVWRLLASFTIAIQPAIDVNVPFGVGVTTQIAELEYLGDANRHVERADLEFRYPVRRSRPEDAVEARFPVVVYVPGLGGDRNDNSHAVAYLVRRGYVVVALRDIAEQGSGGVQLLSPTERDFKAFDMSTDAALAASFAIADRRTRSDAERISRVIDALQRLNDDDAWLLAHRLDLSAIGILGYSIGGAAAIQLLLTDPRVRSAVNLDGWLLAEAVDHDVAKPVMIINGYFPPKRPRQHYGTIEELVEHRRNREQLALHWRQVAHAGSYSFAIDGMTHLDLTDAVYRFPLVEWAMGGPHRRRRWGMIQHMYLEHFFGATLRGETPSRVRSRDAEFPEVLHLQDWRDD